MIVNRNSLVASYTKNGTTHTIYLADYLTKANTGFNKLWDADSGRNLAKSVVGSFDIFPKVICTFKPLNKQELDIIAPLLNAQRQTVTYYDPEKQANYTMTTYTGDWSTDSKQPNLDEPFNVSFIATTRRL